VPVRIHGEILGAHLAIEDANSYSAIIELVNGKMVVHHGPQYTVMTNDPTYDVAIKELKGYQSFGGTKPLPGNIESIDRFVRAEYFLKYLPQPEDSNQGVAFVFQVIRNVAVPFGAPYGGGRGEVIPLGGSRPPIYQALCTISA
jgi:penicillin V acylase-like amidase (Ntn superfamily)